MLGMFFVSVMAFANDAFYLYENWQYMPTQDELVIFKETNDVREEAGLNRLTLDLRLCKAARFHASNMANTRIMSHVLNRSTPGGRAAQFGYPNAVGENIAYGYFHTEVVRTSWMRSTPHRINMLDSSWTRAGIGAGANGVWYHCQLFGN